jgi:hypothetical protein
MAPWLSLDSLLASEIDNGNQGSLYKQLKSKNEEELKKLQDKIEDAETNLGETELSDALRAKASYLAKIGEKVCSLYYNHNRLVQLAESYILLLLCRTKPSKRTSLHSPNKRD